MFNLFDSFKAVVLGVVEGITEFLPISSTGHLILLNQFLSFDEKFTVLFDVVIQLGAILAVVIYFRNKIWPFQKNNQEAFTIWKKALMGIIPFVLLGMFFGETIRDKLFNPWVVASALLIGGVAILIIESKLRKNEFDSVEKLNFKTVFLIGLIQCLAIIPGTSRAAATIMGAIVLGASRTLATEFSFYLAIPTILGASVYSLLKYESILGFSEYLILLIGFVFAFVAALSVIKILMNYSKNHDFKIFGYYRIILGVVMIFYFLIK